MAVELEVEVAGAVLLMLKGLNGRDVDRPDSDVDRGGDGDGDGDGELAAAPVPSAH